MILILLVFSLVCIVVGLVMNLIIRRQEQVSGVLAGKRIYQDSPDDSADILQAHSVPLFGKPDYLLRIDGTIIPVEVKTGKTPNYPYPNHIMQLMAYCLLVEEQFKTRPLGGYIKYPHKEFKIAYTDEAKEALIGLIQEILSYKKSGKEFFCTHPNHNA